MNYHEIEGNNEDKKEFSLAIINDLLNKGSPIYLVEAKWHKRTFLNLEEYTLNNSDLFLTKQKVSLEKLNKFPIFYKIIKP